MSETAPRRPFHPAYLTLVVLAALLAATLLKYRRYFRDILHGDGWTTLAPAPGFPRLSREQSLNLGWAHFENDHPVSSYIDFEPAKKKGEVRIGVFGDSFVAGDETAPGQDFPSLLKERFKSSDYRNVQVINFGVHAYGLHQSALLWDYLGSAYDLDYVVFLVMGLDFRRDDTFTLGGPHYGAVHARYVLDGDGVRLVPVAGQTLDDAALRYYRLLPLWRYLRYDAREPMLLRVWSPREEARFNPFYYRSAGDNGEIIRTYEALIARVASRAKNLIVLYDDRSGLGQVADRLRSVPNLRLLPMQSLSDFMDLRQPMVYKAPWGHPSALGNELTADWLFGFLTGQTSPAQRVTRLEPSARAFDAPSRAWPRPLRDYKTVTFAMGGRAATSLIGGAADQWGRPTDLDLAEAKAGSLLLAFRDAEASALPMPELLRDREPLWASFMVDGRKVHTQVGLVRAPCSVAGVLAFSPKAATGDGWRIDTVDDGSGLLIRAHGGPIEPRLSVGDRMDVPCIVEKVPVGDLPGTKFDCRSFSQPTARFRAVAADVLRQSQLPGSGTLDLTARDPQAGSLRCPLMRYEVGTLDLSPSAARLSDPIGKR